MISALPALVSPCSASAHSCYPMVRVMVCVFSLFGHHGYVAEGGVNQADNRRLDQRTQQSTLGSHWG